MDILLRNFGRGLLVISIALICPLELFSMKANAGSAWHWESGLTEAQVQKMSSVFLQESDTVIFERRQRLTAILLNLTLGLFGMHRVYLGTDIWVPLFYTFTFGGGGVLWIADLMVLTFGKELSGYCNNGRLLMFGGREERREQ